MIVCSLACLYASFVLQAYQQQHLVDRNRAAESPGAFLDGRSDFQQAQRQWKLTRSPIRQSG
jgi:hypothetical protein